MKFLKSNLLYLAMLSFVFVSSFAISLNQKQSVVERTIAAEPVNKNFPQIPELKDGINTFPVISAQSVLAQDLDSGVTLYEKNPDKVVLPASTTKIVTALVAMDHYGLDDVITVHGISVVGQKMGLIEGEKMNVRNLLYGLLVYSANDAAEVLAKNYCIDATNCGREIFVKAMNDKVAQLGLTDTNFSNPTGLDQESHYSTAHDLVRVSVEAMKNPLFAKIVGTRDFIVKSTDEKFVHKLRNINALLGKVDGVKGVKTGWTEGARENLVTYIERDGKRILIALLGSQDRFGETTELINWVFKSYNWSDVIYSYQGH